MTSNEYRVIQGSEAHWPALAELLQSVDLPLEGARAHLGAFLLEYDGDTLVASVGAEVYGDAALVRSLAVRPDRQGGGRGRALLAKALDAARVRGIRAVYLLTTGASGFFEGLGFERVPRAEAPPAMLASTQFRGVCPDSAAFMKLELTSGPSADDVARLPVAVLGAGPAGLAAAAHLMERGVECVVFEAADSVGANLLDYGHVRLFSPWRYNVDKAMAARLAAAGWSAPDPEALPLAREIVERVLRPFAALPEMVSRVRLGHRVLSVSREGFDKVKTAGRDRAAFSMRVARDGGVEEVRVRAVIDATGTWGQPNPLGADGRRAVGEEELADRIAYRIPDVLGADRARYAGQRVLVVGSGHSAANVLLDLAALAESAPSTRLVWAVRGADPSRSFGGGAADQLPARGELGAQLKALVDSGRLELVHGFRTTALARRDGAVTVFGLGPDGTRRTLDGIDEIVCATGQRPDLLLASELRTRLDPQLECSEALGPLIDPNVHSCGTVRPHGHRELSHPEGGFYTIGVKSYGRAPTFLMATGFEQARSVAAALAGDLEAADRVELDLPETGVCSLSARGSASVASVTTGAGGSCGGLPTSRSGCGPGPADRSVCTSAASEPARDASRGCGRTERAASDEARGCSGA